jgi:outer membrane protein TolC
MNTFSVSQDIPFPTKLYLRAKIASKLAKMAYENYKVKERDIIARVKSAYSELVLIYKAIEINKENKDVLDQLSKTATTRYGAGQGTQADALKAQVELARVDNELIMLEQKRLSAQAKLNVLLNRDPKEDLGNLAAEPPVKFTQILDDFYRLARDNNPELKAYRYAVERGQAAYDLSLNEFMPDFTVRFKQMVDKGRAENGAWAGMVGVTIPLWFFEKQSFGVKEMKSDLAMVKAEYRGKENSVLFEVNDAYARAVASKKLIELYETAFIPQAQEAVNVAIKGYESEKTDFLTVLDSQRMLISFKLEHYNATLELRIALADLERTVGIDVDF